MHFSLRHFARPSAVFVATAASLALSQTAHAQVNLAYWNFNDFGAASQAVVPANDPGLVSDSGQTSTIDISSFVATNVVNFVGTTTNRIGTDVAGQALSFQNGTSNVNNGSYLQFSLNTTGYQGISLSYATRNSSTLGFTTQTLQYSLTGANGSFIDAGAFNFSGADTTFNSIASFTGLSAVTNQSNVYFRLVFTGGNGTNSASSNNRIDNLRVSGTAITPGGGTAPEPGALALLLTAGIPMAGVVIRRRRQNRVSA